MQYIEWNKELKEVYFTSTIRTNFKKILNENEIQLDSEEIIKILDTISRNTSNLNNKSPTTFPNKINKKRSNNTFESNNIKQLEETVLQLFNKLDEIANKQNIMEISGKAGLHTDHL